MADAAEPASVAPKRFGDHHGIGFNRCFQHNLAVIADDADGCFIDRDIETGKVFHHTIPSLPFDGRKGRAIGLIVATWLR